MIFPEHITDEGQLDEVMTSPSAGLIQFMASLSGPLVVVGASGKMGPSLCVLASRAARQAGSDVEVIAVARFSEAGAYDWLRQHSLRTISCDVMDRSQVMALPEAPNVVYMVGRKFGTSENPALTWAVNTIPPLHVSERYRDSRIVALSTGCVYPVTPVIRGGSVESDELTPLGEYSNACVARERVFEYCSQTFGTRICQIRLNYALDLRYGVLVDIAQKVSAGIPVDLSMGYANCIWQRDANDMIIRSLEFAASPPRPINITGGDILSVRRLALRFGELMGREVRFCGTESPEALLSNPELACRLLGMPETPLETVLKWTVRWIADGRGVLGKPTHFEVGDGRY